MREVIDTDAGTFTIDNDTTSSGTLTISPYYEPAPIWHPWPPVQIMFPFPVQINYQREPWECPRCHVINGPYADKCGNRRCKSK